MFRSGLLGNAPARPMTGRPQRGILEFAAHFETTLVRRTGTVEKFVTRQRLALGLQPFLQTGLGILLRLTGLQFRHERCVQAGDHLTGGIKTAIARQYAHLGLQVVAETAPLPSFALIANGQKLSPQRQQTLRQVLTSLSPLNNPADRSITQSWGNNLRHGAVNASDADYESVRGLRRRARIPEYGNF